MTKKEFDNTAFKKGMKVMYKGSIFTVLSVDFSENELVLIDGIESTDWISCSECELIK